MEIPEKYLAVTSVLLIVVIALLVLNFNANPGFITGKYPETTEKVSVDFFAMSMCSHCAEFEPVVKNVVSLLDDNVRFRVFYVVSRENGEIRGPHGQEELDENTRQLCINEYYPNEFWNYLLCMVGHYQNPGDFWEGCAERNGIDVGEIRECSQGEEGLMLLEENVKKADYMKITRSPTLMVNKVAYTGKRTENALKDWICDELEEPPVECSFDLEGTSITGAVVGLPNERDFCYQ